jgi:tetratricopeptide (TPR) repeat protein
MLPAISSHRPHAFPAEVRLHAGAVLIFQASRLVARKSFPPMKLSAVLLIAASIASVACGRKEPAVSKQDAVRSGDEAAAKRDYRAAIPSYLAAIASDPQDGEVHYKLAVTYKGANLYQDFAGEATAASDLLPGNREAQLLAIEGMNAMSRFDDALEHLAPQMTATPSDPRVLVLFGNAKARLITSTYVLSELSDAWQKKLDFESVRLRVRRTQTKAEDGVAEEVLRRALELSPNLYEAQTSLISLLWVTSRLDEGAMILKSAADASPAQAFLSRTLGLYYEEQKRDAEAERYLKVGASAHEYGSALALAGFYTRKERFAEALAVLEPLTSSPDEDGTAGVRAGEAEMRLGRPSQAVQRADKILAKDADNVSALLLKARALLAAGEKPQALTAARRAAALDPASREARIVLADALYATGDPAHASDEYTRAWRANTKDPDVAAKLAAVSFALGRYGVAEDLAGQGLRLRPGDLQAAGIFVRAQIHLGNYAEAERTLGPLASANAASADLLALQGTVHAGRENDEAARESFLKALQLDRDSLEALAGLVGVEVRAHHPERVRSRVDPAVARHPREPDYLLLAARVAAAQNDAARAEKALRMILEIDPSHEQALLELAAVLSRNGRQKEVQPVIEQALVRRPDASELRMALGGILERQGQLDEARKEYEVVITDNQMAGGAIDMQRTMHRASAKLAALLANQGRELDRAVQLASAAKRFFPDEPNFSDTLGWAEVRKGSAKVGLPYLDAAIRTDADNALYRYHRGVAYEQLGELAKARVELTRALQSDPNFTGAAQARALLATVEK